jgi:hypothetical protein
MRTTNNCVLQTSNAFMFGFHLMLSAIQNPLKPIILTCLHLGAWQPVLTPTISLYDAALSTPLLGTNTVV